MAGTAVVAGAEPLLALRLGASMIALQASIGALNDLVDAPADRGRKPGKPIPAGLIGPRTARAVVVTGAALGIGLATPSGAWLVALALAVLAIGYGYDTFGKGTAWSWLPFAVGIPLLPVYGWYGAASSLPGWFAALLPMAVVAGAAIAVANARVDLERDLDAGSTTVATTMGLERSWWALMGLWTAVGTIALGSSVALSGTTGGLLTVAAGVAVILVGAIVGRRADPAHRERSWEVQAVGAAITAVAWVVAVA